MTQIINHKVSGHIEGPNGTLQGNPETGKLSFLGKDLAYMEDVISSGGSIVTYSEGIITINGIPVNNLVVESSITTSGIVVNDYLLSENGDSYVLKTYVDDAISGLSEISDNILERVGLLESESDNFVTEETLSYYDTSVAVDNKIANALADELDEDDVTRIVNAAIAKAETDGTIATEDYVDTAINNLAIPSIEGLATVAYVDSEDKVIDDDLQFHKQTDTFRWSDVYRMEYQMLLADAKTQGLIQDDNASAGFFDTPFTISREYGGIVEVTLYNTTTTFSTVIINDEIVYSTEGLPPNVKVMKYFRVYNGDIIQVTNPLTNSSLYTLKLDPNSELVTKSYVDDAIDTLSDEYISISDMGVYGVYHKTGDTIYRTGVDVPFVQNQLGNEQDLIDRDELKAHSDSDLTNISTLFDLFTDQINLLKKQVLDLQGRISNKKLDETNTVDIESQAQGTGYTVNNSLGGVVTFKSPLVILTGTGTLYINGVERWTNVGITVAIGSSGDTLEVQDGDIITCSGMSSITFTPYIAA